MGLRQFLLIWVLTLMPAAAGWCGSLGAQTVFTGFDATRDQLVSTSTTDLSAIWFGFSAVTGFQWWIGSAPGAQDVHPPVAVGAAVTNATATGLTLSVGAKYFITVQGMLPGGGTQTATSAGVLIVLAAAASPPSGTAPVTVEFAAPAAPGVVLYQWQFASPDGFTRADTTSQTDGNAAFTYTQPGTFVAAYQMTQQNGLTLTQTLTIVVAASATAPSVTVQADVLSGFAPLTVNFTQAAQTFDGTVIAYLWDYNGDGTVDQSTTVPTATHTFTAAGNYVVIVTAVDARGHLATASVGITVTQAPLPAPQPPSVTLTSNAGQFSGPPSTGQLLIFTASPTPGTGTIVNYSWDFFGIGEVDLVTTVPTATWQYPDPGTYSPVVTVLDSNNLSAQGSTGFIMALSPNFFRCWITGPPAASPPFTVAGDNVTILAQTVPMGQTLQVDFSYSPSGANTWIPIGTSLPSGSEVFGVHWDVTGLVQGQLYDLRALATFVGGVQGDSTAIQIVTVLVDSTVNALTHTPSDQEFHGSPYTQLKIDWVNPQATAQVVITRDMEQSLLAGSVLSYDQLRIQHQADNPHALEGRLQGMRFIPGHFRGTTFVAGSTLQKPSRVSMYLNGDLSSILADGTDVSRSTVALFRFEPSRARWEPLLGSIKITSKTLLQATMIQPGDVAVVVMSTRPIDNSPVASSGSSSSPCGMVGLEGLPLGLLLFLWRRRKA
jgi:PKD repeat protein